MAIAQITTALRRLRQLIARRPGHEASDGRLLARFAADRDEEAFATLVARHGPAVLGVCRRVLSEPQDADDAFQATFLVLARKAASVQDRGSIGGWLFRVAHWTAIRLRRQRARRAAVEQGAGMTEKAEQVSDCDSGQVDPAAGAVRREAAAAVDEELQRLPEKYRTALVLCYLEGQTHEDAARQLGLPLGTLKTWVNRGRDALGERLRKRGVDLGAGGAVALLGQQVSAAVPAALAQATTQAAVGFAAGAAQVASSAAGLLAREVLQIMFPTKLRLAVVLALVLGLGAAAGWAAFGNRPAELAPAAPKQVGGAKKGEGKERPGPVPVDGSDPLPDGAKMRLGEDRWLHDIIARFAAFTPDGKKVVTVTDDRTIRVWEFPSGKEIRRIALPAPDLSASQPLSIRAALSKDGKTVATWIPEEASAVYLHELATGKKVASLKVTTEKVYGLAFSPEGDRLACLTNDGTVRIWEWAKAREVCNFAAIKPIAAKPFEFGKPFAPSLGGVYYAPDGKSLATGYDRVVKLWDPATGAELRTIRGENITSILSLAFAPDGKTLAITTSESIVLVEPATGKEVGKLTLPVRLTPIGGGPGLEFGHDGARLYLMNYLGKLFEWDVATGKLLRQYDARADGVSAGPSRGVSLSSDGNTLVRTGVGPIFHDLRGKQITTLLNRTVPLASLQFSHDGTHLLTVTAYLQYESVQTYDAVTGKATRKNSWPGVTSPMALSPDGKVLAAAKPEEPNGAKPGKKANAADVVLIDSTNGKELGRLPVRPRNESARRMRFSPDGKLLAVGAGARIELYEVPAAKLLHTINFPEKGLDRLLHTETLRTMVFSPDGKMLAARAEPSGTLGFWDTATGQQIGSLLLPQGSKLLFLNEHQGMDSAAFSQDGRCLVLDGDDGTAVLHELASAQPRRTFGKKFAPKAALAMGPGRAYLTPDTYKAGSCFAFSPDGSLLVRGGFDRIVRVYDIQTGKELAAFQGHDGAVTALAFAPDGKTVVSASADSTALVWDITKVKRPAVPAKALQPGDLEACWQALAETAAAKAFDAISDLAAAPAQTVPLLQKHLRAAKEAAPAEAKPLVGKPLRAVRAVEVLELIGTAEARRVLEALARGTAGARETTEAQAALRRLGR